MSRREWDGVSAEYGVKFSYPRMLGAYLAVNAVPDLWMMIDAPDCATMRAEMIYDNHDWNSTVLAEDGKHRIACTSVGPDSVATDRREVLAAHMERLASQEGKYLLVYPAPAVALVGIDYRAIFDRVKHRVPMELMMVSHTESLGDWVSGYEQIVDQLARTVPLPEVPRKEDGVAVVGYFWDRNEADHHANITELRRLLEGLGLSLESVWLSGVPSSDLAAVAGASTIIALPYAGEAAGILAERTGAKVVQTGLPVGLAGTVKWLHEVAEATGRASGAEGFIREEATRHYELLAKPALRYFRNRDFLVCTEGYLAVAVADMVRELGGLVRLVACSGRTPDYDPGPFGELLAAPEVRSLGFRIKEIAEASSLVPVIICNEQAVSTTRSLPIAGVFLGFQSPGTHHLYDAPFMGFRGAVSLVDRIVNAIPTAMCFHR